MFLCGQVLSDDGSTKIEPSATGFFVRVRDEGSSLAWDYVVTARHCIEEALADGGQLYIRINTLTNHYEVESQHADWFTHDSADVAAILMTPESLPPGIAKSDLDQASITTNSFTKENWRCIGTDPDFGNFDVGVSAGLEVYLVGLFSENFGYERNLPVARFGHISRMPSELSIVSGQIQCTIVAYLAEFQSWGGHSGSPVFFLNPMNFETETDDGIRFETGYVTGLLGLVSGHYDLPQPIEPADAIGNVQVKMNSGMAYVTPAHEITALLMRDDLVEARTQKAAEILAKQKSAE